MNERLARLRDVATSLLEVAGAISICYGIGLLLGVAAAFIVGGVFAGLAGYLLGGEGR